MPKSADIYQIKVTLHGSQPLIWRRIQVTSDTTLAKLHRILQCVMGWKDARLHQFVIQGHRYGIPDDHVDPSKTKDERRHELREIVAAASRLFVYQYDFGDDWQHTLEIEKTCPLNKSVRYPFCLAGDRSCPPEDVGGIPGYENFLEALRDPKHPEHDELLEWIGGTFDPDMFDVEDVNQKLRGMR